ncbi:MFS transporter [Paraburkholderia sp. Cy-641]|uniref:MFS transporter n=1 Tax=Paraburkholderia sp. Cy-641 TaxID=2608337 RepID=UPI001423734C|nr:MFS transporter [Paraburkholderia sp. Cy-641]NIF79460.1 MFS transporter [Paraburkholderia sp. Cy-641]
MQVESIGRNGVHTAQEARTEIQRSALRKNTWRFMPLLLVAFIINYLDRTSVGYAALTMNSDLRLTPAQFGWGAGILFAGYCFFEIPSNLALHHYGARRWLARIMITWGLAEAATSLVQGPTSFYIMRFLLGVAEAGFFPGATLFLSCWFPPRERVRVQALFALGIPLSAIIGAPLSTSILRWGGFAGMHGWQAMFIIEGLPAVLVGFVVYAVLRNKPEDAHWLTPDERTELAQMLNEGTGQHIKKDLTSALKDPRVLMLAAIQCGFVLGGYGVGVWLPQILRGHGLRLSEIGLLATIPPLASACVLLTWSYVVTLRGRPVTNLAIMCLIGGIGLALAAHFNSLGVVMLGITLTSASTISAVGILWTIPTTFLSERAAAGGLAFINSIGTLGGFAGPYIIGILKETTGAFSAGIWAMSGFLFVSAILAAVLVRLVESK